MMDNQRATSSSTFQPQQTAQPSVESLLFNDIIEEKSQILSDLMNQFLQVQPFSKFESEFNLFLRRIKHITREEQRKGTYRHPIQIPSYKDTPTENDVSQENNRQHIESFNLFQRPTTIKHKPKTTLTYNDQLKNIPCTSNNSCDTIIEESIINNSSAHENPQQSKFLPPTAPIPYSKSLQINDAFPNTSNIANADDVMESDAEVLESFKTPSNSDNTSTSQLNQDQSNCSERSDEKIKVKNLTNWSVNLKEIKSNKGNSKPVIALTSTLLARDQITELKKVHKAGVLVARKAKNIIKTDKGFYHLIGSIAEGSPPNLLRACIETNGIPKTWRSILTHLTTKVEVNLNESVTRKGTIYNKEKKASHNVPETEEFSEEDLPRDLLNGLNDSDFRRQLLQLSSPKTTSFGGCQTPSQLLKHKFHRKFVKACLIIGSLEDSDEQ
ncbi:uncharacterized protein LOC126555318 [Aphis gossypii]|uniref:uncharacterized protein LOC126555318 n=1 Tax=Aphis gossypii TaxID=80765 RepID=UPI0021594ACD|nr:uncharacterized protein LOC126555318 [Aphis gossypii]